MSIRCKLGAIVGFAFSFSAHAIDRSKLVAYYSFDSEALVKNSYTVDELARKGATRPTLDLSRSKLVGASAALTNSAFFKSVTEYSLSKSYCLNSWIYLNTLAGDPTFYSGSSTTPGCGMPNQFHHSSSEDIYGRFGNGSDGWDSDTDPSGWSPVNDEVAVAAYRNNSL